MLRKMMSAAGGVANRKDKHTAAATVKKYKTAGLIVIGDEILKGTVFDTNSHFICKQLYGMGVKVGKISVIGDGIDEIANEVRHFSTTFDFVVTTGGIGPTHDDMTYKGVAKAFSQPIVQHKKMSEMVEKWLGNRGLQRDIIMKMAEMPESAELLMEADGHTADKPVKPVFPIVNVNNVFVFPGIPKFLEKMFPRMQKILAQRYGVGSEHFHFREIFISRDEMSITPQLNVAVEKFKDSVIFGSYPVIDNLYFSTRITMDSHSQDKVQEASSFLTSLLPDGSVVSYDKHPLTNAADSVYAIAQDGQHPLHQTVSAALFTIEEALQKYSMEELTVCFNGGKDCTALLHLVYAVVCKKQLEHKDRIPVLWIRNDNPFPEMEDFVRETCRSYKLNLLTYRGPIQSGLRTATSEHPQISGVFMGTRRSDPSGRNLKPFQLTDSDWPKVMRISPMLDWSYEQVWMFLRNLTLPYCSLYDRGYTSIGSQTNTLPNQKLAYVTEDGGERYRPAYTLTDSSEERTGRIVSDSSAAVDGAHKE